MELQKLKFCIKTIKYFDNPEIVARLIKWNGYEYSIVHEYHTFKGLLALEC